MERVCSSVDNIFVVCVSFGRYLRCCHLEFDKEAVKMPGIDRGFRILCDLIELSYCDPFGPW